MTILVLTNNFRGLHSFRKEVMQALKDEGYRVVVSAPYDENVHFFEEMGLEVIDTSFNRKGMNPLSDIGLMMRYIRLIKQVRPDVVLTYTIKPNLYGGMACQICGVPQIANITGLGPAVENPGWLQKVTILLYRVGLRKTNTVFLQNKMNMDFCVNHRMVRGKKVLIPGSGVNLQYHICREYPAEKPIRFIFISRLLKEKGIEEYIGAAERIKELYPQTEFHILGDSGEAYQQIIENLQERGIVKYHGRQADVRPFIGMCHCTIHPSYYAEGMSNVLLESCATGRPVITTNRPGCGEIVDDGRTGFLVKAKDVDNLVSVIERFLQLPHDQKALMGLNARKKVEREFDRQIVVNAYLTEIENIQGKNGRECLLAL